MRRFSEKDGKAGVDVARRLRELKEVEQLSGAAGAAFMRAAGTRFFPYRGMWVDERFDPQAEQLMVKFGSEAYFKLIERAPRLIDALKLGTDVVLVTAEGKVVAVSAAGKETLTEAELDACFMAKSGK